MRTHKQHKDLDFQASHAKSQTQIHYS